MHTTNTISIDALATCASHAALAAAILNEASHASYVAEVARCFAHETQAKRDALVANYAINNLLAEELAEASNFDAVALFDDALRLALMFDALRGDLSFVMNTDEPCMMWSSPFDFTTKSPAEYAFARGTICLFDDEGAFTDEANTCPLLRGGIDRFLEHTKAKLPAAAISTYARDYLHVDDEPLVAAVPYLLAA